jgi:membrane associated rhomboid family serine protease
VAFGAHVGGFVAGVVLIKLFERRTRVKARLAGTKLSPEEVWRIGRR